MRRRSSFFLSLPVCLALLSAAVTAHADQKDPRLDGLFARLKTAATLEAGNIEQQIWAIWMTSDNDEVNRLMAIGVQAMQAQEYPAALVYFTRMVELAPDFAEGWNKRATVLYLVGDYQGSLADVDKTLALEPRHFGALSGLGLIDVQLDRDEDAVSAWERALAINPNMPSIRANLEGARQRLKDEQI